MPVEALQREWETEGDLPLGAWPELAPDPAAVDRVLTVMLSAGVKAGTGAGAAPGAATAVTSDLAESQPGESHFRLLTWLWAAAALVGYLASSLLGEWVAEHPVVSAAIAVVVCLSLLTPFVLLPVRRQQMG